MGFQLQVAVFGDIEFQEQIVEDHLICQIKFQLSNNKMRGSVFRENRQLGTIADDGGNVLHKAFVAGEQMFPAKERVQKSTRVFPTANLVFV
jgi:hypothetical protein